MSAGIKPALSLAFTGERVVPGDVDPQLWNEHVSRYYYAQQFASAQRILDMGCGAGYGTDLLSQVAELAIGFDNSLEATQYAQQHYPTSIFLTSSAEAVPLASQSFGLVTAFEVIEHVTAFAELISEAARLLTSNGVFLVSTPNSEYYAETRQEVGPNPFHVHEFDFAEFESSLRREFQYVRILTQNQSEAIVFSGVGTSSASARITENGSAATGHFYVAVCSHEPVPIPNFTYVSDSGNLLRDRERHIVILKEEVRETHEQHLRLLDFHNELHAVLAERTQSNASLQAELAASKRGLSEFTRSSRSLHGKTGWDNANGSVISARITALERELASIRDSRLIKVGQFFGVGPYTNRFRPRSAIRNWLRRRADRWGPVLAKWWEASKQLTLYLIAFPALFCIALAILGHDLCFSLIGRRKQPRETAPRHDAASIIIPNWNGRDLLQRYLPSVLAASASFPGSEIIVVDNNSNDESVKFLQSRFPQVRVLSMATNRGFAEAANAGAAAAVHDVIVLLNNDMRVEREFLSALLPLFRDPLLFACSSQIFLADKTKRREETGLTEVWWEAGRLRVGHRIDDEIRQPFPCAYAGGGSSAFDRRKFLELGGLDRLFRPFYYEDTDISRMAWARGWKILYVPGSIVHHEHRATIGKTFERRDIDAVIRRNSLLYGWKNLGDWRILASNISACFVSLCQSKGKLPPDLLAQDGDVRALFKRLPMLLRSRWRAKSLKLLSDRETFQVPRGGHFRDRFLLNQQAVPERLNVLFAAPYPISPPHHGGAVFMREALVGLRQYADVHLVSFLDTQAQLDDQADLHQICKTAVFLIRPAVCLDDQWTLTPNAIREFAIRDFSWAIHRAILLEQIDVVQLEYTILGQYGERFRRIPCMLFEHDISVQSLRRRVRTSPRDGDLLLEYVRMRLYEPRLLKRFTRVQVCSEANAQSLRNLTKAVTGKLDCDVRAGIDVSRYPFTLSGREANTLLFIGSFRHKPNVDALQWFVFKVFPSVLQAKPDTVLHIVGSGAPNSADWLDHPNIRVLGSVADVRAPLQRFSVFLCPIQSGSGVRVKLLEAFAMGIPAISTSVGAEGLASPTSLVCEIADSPEDFARSTIRLLVDRDHRERLAVQARRRVEERWDARVASERLMASYRGEVQRLRT